MKKTLLVLTVLVLGFLVWNLTRKEPPPQGGGKRPKPIPDAALNLKVVAEVAAAYNKDVEPLLKRACFDCHSTQTEYPWYHHVPGVKQYLDGHVKEAGERLDLTKGFPFVSRKPLVSRIRGIGGSVKRRSMPLWDYRLMHPASHFTPEEEKTIIDWAEGSFKKLSETAKPYQE